MRRIRVDDIKDELVVQTSRGGGPGGQHVNKVETKVVLKWNIGDSNILTDLQKEMIRAANRNKITNQDELHISSEAKRSQLKNKEIAFKKLDRILARSFAPRKHRISTTPTKASKVKRLHSKRKQSEKKEWRRRIL